MATVISAATLAGLRAKVAKLPQPKPRGRYGNVKKVVGFDLDGKQVTFDSGHEAKRWSELVLMQRAGEISGLSRQTVFRFQIAGRELRYKAKKKLGRAVRYEADFDYFDETGTYVVEDAKGVRTREYKLKWALMQLFHGIEVKEV
jgi:hypothetical protein